MVLLYAYTCVLCLSLFGIAAGFKCFTCNYTIDTKEDWNQPECIDNPERLSHINCNESFYCVVQETYSTEKNMVTHLYRSCLTTSIGNKCVTWLNQIVCRASCQSDFCNNETVTFLRNTKTTESFLSNRTDVFSSNKTDAFFSNRTDAFSSNILILYMFCTIHVIMKWTRTFEE